MTCCIVGAGPAGVMLAWLLAREGIAVTLLERHADFERDFRGDTLQPGILEILDQLNLVDDVLAASHSRMQTLAFHWNGRRANVADLARVKTRFPFVAMLPQARFLELLVNDARRFPSLRVVMSADVQELIEEQREVRGVRYRDAGGDWQEVRSLLTVATDGRSSRLRRLAGMQAVNSSPESDVLWFRMGRREGQVGGAYLACGGYMIALARDNQWQVGYVILKGTYPRLKAAGIESLREAVKTLAPELAPSANELTDWQQVRLLSVQADRLKTWYRPGLLFLGDAAHVMSPVGGVGINYAIQDAVEAANILAGPLKSGRITLAHLRKVQRRRQWQTRVIQFLQAIDQRFLIEAALHSRGSYHLPLWLRVLLRTPWLRNIPSRLFAFGVRRVRVASGGQS